MSSTIDIEDALEFVEVREQVMKAKRVISRRFNHIDINNDIFIFIRYPSLHYFLYGFLMFRRSKFCTTPMASTLVTEHDKG